VNIVYRIDRVPPIKSGFISVVLESKNLLGHFLGTRLKMPITALYCTVSMGMIIILVKIQSQEAK
jgi:hypothetical protein